MAEASDRDLGIQNDFFNQARKSRSRITILLNSGKRLAGRIKSFDRYTLILDAGGGAEEMVFKHAIATITVGGRPHMEARHESAGASVSSVSPVSSVSSVSSGAPVPAQAVETKSET
jgi:host factor-I protein